MTIAQGVRQYVEVAAAQLHIRSHAVSIGDEAVQALDLRQPPGHVACQSSAPVEDDLVDDGAHEPCLVPKVVSRSRLVDAGLGGDGF